MLVHIHAGNGICTLLPGNLLEYANAFVQLLLWDIPQGAHRTEDRSAGGGGALHIVISTKGTGGEGKRGGWEGRGGTGRGTRMAGEEGCGGRRGEVSRGEKGWGGGRRVRGEGSTGEEGRGGEEVEEGKVGGMRKGREEW
jgi:hypothetical protein